MGREIHWIGRSMCVDSHSTLGGVSVGLLWRQSLNSVGIRSSDDAGAKKIAMMPTRGLDSERDHRKQ